MDVNLATTVTLEVLDSLATFADDHAYSLRGHLDGLGRSALATTTGVVRALACGHGVGSSALLPSVVALNNLKDEVFRDIDSLHAADQVDGTKAINTLCLTQDVDVTTTALLKVFDRLTTTANDKAYSLVGNHDLSAIFTVTESRQIDFRTTRHTSGVSTLVLHDIGTAILFDDAEDCSLCRLSASCWACDSALALGSMRILGLEELYTCTGLRLDLPEVLTSATDDQTNK